MQLLAPDRTPMSPSATAPAPASTIPAPGTPLPHVRATGSAVPGPELPPVAPKHPALPAPPSLEQLATLADRAPRQWRFPSGAPQSEIRNAHYSNTRSQLAYALAHEYNSVEGDVRLRDGRPVMQHDPKGRADLTFEQWAVLADRAGKHLRVDVKEVAALQPVAAILERLGVDPGRVTFNVGLDMPWSTGTSIDDVRALRDRFPGCRITLNLPLPLGPGYLLACRAADAIGHDRLGVAVMGNLVHRGDIALLRRHFEFVNAWNLPLLGDPDVAALTAKLRSIGVNGMVDLRRRDDPLADD
jgi:hypothetical protein